MTEIHTDPRTATRGQIVRFIPRTARRSVTIRIVGTFDGVGVSGYRCTVENDGTVATRGNLNAYFV